MISAVIRTLFAIFALIILPRHLYKKVQDSILDKNQPNDEKIGLMVYVMIGLMSCLYITYAEMPGHLNQLHITLEGTIKEFVQTEQGRAIKRYKVTIIDENEKEILLASVETPPEETIEIGDKIEICYYQFRIKPNRPIVKINGVKTEFYGIGDLSENVRFFTSTSLSMILIWNIIIGERRYYKHKKEAGDTKKEKELSIIRRLGSVVFHLAAFYSLWIPGSMSRKSTS